MQPLKDVPQEAQAIKTHFPAESVTRLNNPSVEALARSLRGKGTWFFLGHGDAYVRGEFMPLFVGDNGLCANGLQAISMDALVTTMSANCDRLSLVVLNGCKTLSLAREILARCPTVSSCVCWESASHSSAASVFGAAFAQGLAEYGGHKRAVKRAFEAAKATLLRQLEPGRLSGGVPVGLPRYALVDPEDASAVHHCCPCEPRCAEGYECPLIGRLRDESGTRWGGQRPPLAAGVPCVLCRATALDEDDTRCQALNFHSIAGPARIAAFDVGGSTEDLPEPRYARRFARDGGAMRERAWSPEAAEVAGGAAR